ncbi:hypothetical protein F2Q70_00016777 [Brassica cretica]|uniref:Uncharacterized protein n=1 Tax=Brassica cretica TaxID=69181 RepID=A0A8S9HY58_BRACR|nr:hypothetical protein F2Q70_00016777 [Brassica cretica]
MSMTKSGSILAVPSSTVPSSRRQRQYSYTAYANTCLNRSGFFAPDGASLLFLEERQSTEKLSICLES